MIQEYFDKIPLQEKRQLLVQLEDGLPHIFPMILHPDFVLQKYPQHMDVRNGHNLVELRMMEVFHKANM